MKDSTIVLSHVKIINGVAVCHKKPYTREKDALSSLKHIQLTKDSYDEKSCYECTICSCWHLTSWGKDESQSISEHNNLLKAKISKPKTKRNKSKSKRKRNSSIGHQLGALLNLK